MTQRSTVPHFTHYITQGRGVGIIYGRRLHALRSWLRHCTTSRMVASSILNVSLEFFSEIILPAAPRAFGATQPLD
jgi:hypothetical protein